MVNKQHAVLGLFDLFVLDMKATFPELCNTVDALSNYIHRIVESKGHEQVLYLQLPQIGVAFDSGLSSGHYVDPKCGIGACPSKRHTPIGRLLSQVFDSTWQLYPDVDPDMVFFLRTLFYLFKKVKVECPEDSKEKAVEQFLRIERDLREPSLHWDGDRWHFVRFTFGCELPARSRKSKSGTPGDVVDGVFRYIVPQQQLDAASLLPRHGPGAVSDTRTGNDKYRFEYWPLKLSETFLPDTHRCHNQGSVADYVDWSHKEPPAKLMAVPKSYKGPRLITAEPTAHQYCQQAVLAWVRANMPKPLAACVNFSSQESSREAARLASLDGSNATVDLSSASDRLSCWTVERAFSSNRSLLEALYATRTRTVVNGTGTSHDFSMLLKKYAGQGNATTFPVQSIVYAGLAIASVIYDENLPVNYRTVLSVARRVRVFGDDIIIPSSNVPTLAWYLDALQLQVNRSKTHSEGNFRESCGMDAYKGYDVTPLYVSHHVPGDSPEDIASWVEVSNNAHSKGLWRMSAGMIDLLSSAVYLPVNVRSGLSLSSFVQDSLPTRFLRYNKELHRWETRVLSLATKAKVGRRESWDNLLQFFIEAGEAKYLPHLAPAERRELGFVISNTSILRKVWVEVRLQE